MVYGKSSFSFEVAQIKRNLTKSSSPNAVHRLFHTSRNQPPHSPGTGYVTCHEINLPSLRITGYVTSHEISLPKLRVPIMSYVTKSSHSASPVVTRHEISLPKLRVPVMSQVTKSASPHSGHRLRHMSVLLLDKTELN